MSNCQYVRTHYGVPACIGRRVRVYGDAGIIAEDRGHYIGVNFDKDKPGRISNCHPTDKVEYLELGTIRPMTRAQRNYRNFLNADCGCTFAEWLKFRTT